MGNNGNRPNNGNDLKTVISRDGPGPLQDKQLLALLLGASTAENETLGVSGEVILASGGTAGLADATYAELRGVRGVGPVRAAVIIAAMELGRRALSGTAPGARLSSSAEVYRAFCPWMVNERVEVFSCAMVDAKLGLIRTEVISRGTLTASIVHPREAFRPAVRNAASGVIFAHNHPSGDHQPSDEDRRITGRLDEVGRILGIPLLDHVVIGAEGSYYSFADAGILEPQSYGCRGMVLR